MRNVILFIRRYLTFFTFLFLQIVSLWFLYSFNQFHQAQFLQTANEITGEVNKRYKNFENFFLQGEENRRLHRVNDSLLNLNLGKLSYSDVFFFAILKISQN